MKKKTIRTDSIVYGGCGATQSSNFIVTHSILNPKASTPATTKENLLRIK